MTKITSTKTLPGGITQEQYDAWVEKYGNVFTITVTDKDDTYTGYLRPVANRNIMSRMLTLQASKQPWEAGELALNECWLGGDEILKPSVSTNQKNINLEVEAALLANAAFQLPGGTVKKNV